MGLLKPGAGAEVEFRSQREDLTEDRGGRADEEVGQQAARDGDWGAATAYLHPLDHGKQVRGLGKRVDTRSKKRDQRPPQSTAASARLSSAMPAARFKSQGEIRARHV